MLPLLLLVAAADLNRQRFCSQISGQRALPLQIVHHMLPVQSLSGRLVQHNKNTVCPVKPACCVARDTTYICTSPWPTKHLTHWQLLCHEPLSPPGSTIHWRLWHYTTAVPVIGQQVPVIAMLHFLNIFKLYIHPTHLVHVLQQLLVAWLLHVVWAYKAMPGTLHLGFENTKYPG